MGSINSPEYCASYEIEEHPINHAKYRKVICIGAGPTGLNLAYQIQKHLQNVELVCYEKNPKLGGTWYENRYPGVACDIPSHIYQFLWAVNPDWSEFYATGPEILQYLEKIAADRGLNKFFELSHEVTGAEWVEERGMWKVAVHDKANDRYIEDHCHFLVNASGFLNDWQWPAVPGLKSFQGDLLHSASWDESIDLSGKKVAIIGNGSSGIQITTALQPVVEELTVLVRNPTWISSSYAQQFAGPNGSNFKYTNEQKEKFRQDPNAFKEYYRAIETDMNGHFDLNLKGSAMQEYAKNALTAMMKHRLGDKFPDPERLIPTFEAGCRRFTPGTGYLEALSQPNTRLVDTGIDQVLNNGIRLVSGEVIQVDAIVCATGFITSWKPRFKVIGRGGINLSDQWKTRATSYLSFAVPNFPNYFVFLGPNAPLNHGSAFPTIEHLSKYLLRLIHKLQTQDYKAAEPLQEAVDDFIEHADKFMERTVWYGECRAWFRADGGTGVPLTHPGSRLHSFETTLEPRWEDWRWTRNTNNRFSFLGNGLSSSDADGKDKSWYLKDPNQGLGSIRY